MTMRQSAIGVFVAVLIAAICAPSASASPSTRPLTYKCQQHPPYTVFAEQPERKREEAWLLHIRIASASLAHLRRFWPPPKIPDAGPLTACGVASGVMADFLFTWPPSHHLRQPPFHYTCRWSEEGHVERQIEMQEVVCVHRGRYPVTVWFSGALEANPAEE